jgi:hypothetical protein
MSTPPATRWSTYPGDVSHMIGEVVGPNTLGETLTAVTTEYVPETDRTRVGFTFQLVEPP